MRPVLITVLMLALVAPAQAAKASPSLRLVDTSPLTVRGVAFGPRQAVVVTVRQDGLVRARRTVRASATGGFAVSFAATSIHRCSGAATITAVNSAGAVAKLRLAQPLCPLP